MLSLSRNSKKTLGNVVLVKISANYFNGMDEVQITFFAK